MSHHYSPKRNFIFHDQRVSVSDTIINIEDEIAQVSEPVESRTEHSPGASESKRDKTEAVSIRIETNSSKSEKPQKPQQKPQTPQKPQKPPKPTKPYRVRCRKVHSECAAKTAKTPTPAPAPRPTRSNRVTPAPVAPPDEETRVEIPLENIVTCAAEVHCEGSGTERDGRRSGTERGTEHDGQQSGTKGENGAGELERDGRRSRTERDGQLGRTRGESSAGELERDGRRSGTEVHCEGSGTERDGRRSRTTQAPEHDGGVCNAAFLTADDESLQTDFHTK